MSSIDATLCARVSDAAALEGVNVPVNKMPLAWPGLNPGCDPNMASNCFKISSLSAINFSSFGSGMSVSSSSLVHLVRSPAQLPQRDQISRGRSASETNVKCLDATPISHFPTIAEKIRVYSCRFVVGHEQNIDDAQDDQ